MSCTLDTEVKCTMTSAVCSDPFELHTLAHDQIFRTTGFFATLTLFHEEEKKFFRQMTNARIRIVVVYRNYRDAAFCYLCKSRFAVFFRNSFEEQIVVGRVSRQRRISSLRVLSPVTAKLGFAKIVEANTATSFTSLTSPRYIGKCCSIWIQGTVVCSARRRNASRKISCSAKRRPRTALASSKTNSGNTSVITLSSASLSIRCSFPSWNTRPETRMFLSMRTVNVDLVFLLPKHFLPCLLNVFR